MVYGCAEESGAYMVIDMSTLSGEPGLTASEVERLLESAKAIAVEKIRLTAGYGGMDIVQAAYDHAGLDSEFGILDLTTEEVALVCAAYRETVAECCAVS